MKYIIAILSYFITLVALHRVIEDTYMLALVAIIVGALTGIVFEKSNTRQQL